MDTTTTPIPTEPDWRKLASTAVVWSLFAVVGDFILFGGRGLDRLLGRPRGD